MQYLKLGGALPALKVLLQAEAGFNLSGATVAFALKKPDATLVTRASTILNAATAYVQHDFIATDFDAVGRYKGEFIVTVGTLPRYFPDRGWINFDVSERLT